MPGRSDLTEEQIREEENKEREIVLGRHLPFHITKVFFTAFLTAIVMSVANWNFITWTSLFLWNVPAYFILGIFIVTFYYLIGVIVDIYLLKLPLYIVARMSGKFNIMKAEKIATPEQLRDEHYDDKAFVMINPLRPDNDEQLRNVIRKTIEVLSNVESKNVVSVLLLQAVSPDTDYPNFYNILN